MTESALKWKWFQHPAWGKNVPLTPINLGMHPALWQPIFFFLPSNRNIHLAPAYITYTATWQPFRTHQIRSAVECTTRLIRCVREKLASRGDEVPGGRGRQAAVFIASSEHRGESKMTTVQQVTGCNFQVRPPSWKTYKAQWWYSVKVHLNLFWSSDLSNQFCFRCVYGD